MKTEHRRGQFTFYASYFDAVDRQPKSRRMEAFYAIVRYALDGIEPEGLSASVNSMFEGLRPNIDSGRSKAEKMTGARTREGAGIKDQGSGIKDQGSGIKDQGSGIKDQGSGIKDQGSGIDNAVGAVIGRPPEAESSRQPDAVDDSHLIRHRACGGRPMPPSP